MIDRQARDSAAEKLRHFAAGRISNDALEDSWPTSRCDLAVSQLFRGGAWYLYSDTRRYRLVGRDRLSRETRREVARWIVFLKTDLPYEWPTPRAWSQIFMLLTNLLTLGLAGMIFRRWFARHGEIAVWPFLRRSDFEEALSSPRYLRGAA